MCAPKFKIKWGVAYHQNTLKVSTWRFGFFFIHNKQLLPIIWIYEWYAYWIKKETFFFTGSQVDDTNNDREDCITSEEAIHGNLKKISISADNQTKYDP